MENASKALLMAAGVLIGMLILSLAIYLFLSFGSQSAKIHDEQETQRLEQFNSQFTSYQTKEDITIYDIVTVANLASENNIYYELPRRNATNGNDNYIQVTVADSALPFSGSIENGYNSIVRDYNQLISNVIRRNAVDTKYRCNITMSETTRKSVSYKFY